MLRYAYALRAARGRQLKARVARPLRRRRFPRGPGSPFVPLAENRDLWLSAAFAPLGASPESGSRLAQFHSAYAEDILQLARDGGDAASAARAWAEAHPPAHDDAWHPYVASTRAANWLAAATLDPAVLRAVDEPLRRALARVAANVEDDILGNHVIRNAKALVLGGVAFGDAGLRARGQALLRRELREQILADGGHYERSPAYHRLVLRDLLELRPYVDVEDEVGRMTGFAAASSRPDGAPWLFNDGGLDVAPRLGLAPVTDGMAVFPETGYVFVRAGPLSLAFDCGPPSPPFLPAHAHADALSIQLWLDESPIVVDPGTSTYERGAQRDRERGTEAHSTVAVDGDQFLLWGAFRAGPLPDVLLLEASPKRLRGEIRLRSGIVHRRTIEIGEEVEVVDELQGTGTHSIVSSIVGTGAATSLGPLAATPEEREYAERFDERTLVPASVQRGQLRLPEVIGWRIDLRTMSAVNATSEVG